IFQSWIRACQEEHRECVAYEPGPFLPTRLLDLRTKIVRLVDSCDLKASSGQQYVALSCCSGCTTPESAKTTRKTLEARRAGIELKLLPRTLKDAIHVTRSLGIPFIWINALCLIQGDEEDWHKECRMMAKVYSHVVLTITTLRARHYDEGFIPLARPYLRIGLHDIDRLNFAIQGEMTSLQDPLYRRGWALQEHQLSTRIINFSQEYFVWRCREKLLCYNTKLDWLSRWSRSFDIGACLSSESLSRQLRCFDLAHAFQTSGERPIPNQLWQSMVEDFSARQFTVSTDKLPALSGLAVVIGRHFQSEYLAGLWRDDLKADLLWESIRSPGDFATHPAFTSYYAPSRSWASTNSPVKFHEIETRMDEDLDGEGEMTTEIVETHIEKQGPYLLPGCFILLHTQIWSMEGVLEYSSQFFKYN
ncbi:hypothetical protein BKA61DRAFT_693923, partial [Leptodontidium sp. MPI-SDFR-AT-0119]